MSDPEPFAAMLLRPLLPSPLPAAHRRRPRQGRALTTLAALGLAAAAAAQTPVLPPPMLRR